MSAASSLAAPGRRPRKPLPPAEQRTLDRLEGVVRRGLKSFVEVGEALYQIREERLFRAEFGSFEEYLAAQWNLGPSAASRLIRGSQAARSLPDDLPAPTAESQVRPLTVLSPEDGASAYRDAVETAGGNVPTAAQVVAAAEAFPRVASPHAKVPADPVERARAKGIVPADAVVESTPPPPAADEDDAEPAGPTDDEWLESLPARSHLSGPVREMFDAEALAYRSLKTARDAYRKACQAVMNPMQRSLQGRVGPWASKHRWHYQIKDPADWGVCDDCQGKAFHDLLKAVCPTCKGCGYHV